MRKALFAVCLLAGVTIPSAPSQARQISSFQDEAKDLVMPWRFYKRLAQCETAGNPKHSTRSYTGAFGMARTTTFRWSGHRSVSHLSILAQARIADRVAWHGWTDNTGKYWWPVGPWGWGAIKKNCNNLQSFICRSPHPKVQKWKRGC